MSNNETKKPSNTYKVLPDKVIRTQSTGYEQNSNSYVNLDKIADKLEKGKENEKEKVKELYNNNTSKLTEVKENKGENEEIKKKLNVNANVFIPKSKNTDQNVSINTNTNLSSTNNLSQMNNTSYQFVPKPNMNLNVNMTNIGYNQNSLNQNFINQGGINQGMYNNGMLNNSNFYNQNLNYNSMNYNTYKGNTMNNFNVNNGTNYIPNNTLNNSNMGNLKNVNISFGSGLNTESKPYKPQNLNLKGTINTTNHGHGPDSLAETPVKQEDNTNKFNFETVNKNKDSSNKDKDIKEKDFNLTNEENKKEFSIPNNNEENTSSNKNTVNTKKPSKLDNFLKEPNVSITVKTNNTNFIPTKTNEKETNKDILKALSIKEQEAKKQKEREEQEKKEKLKENQSKGKDKVTEQVKIITEKIYMTFTEGEIIRQNKMTCDYMILINKFKGCSKTDILPRECIEHFTLMEKFKVEKIVKNSYADNTRENAFQKGSKFTDKHDEKESNFTKSSKYDNLISDNENKGLNKWAKLDLSKHKEEAENVRKMMTIAREEDPIKDEIMFYLNKLTVDKYREVYEGILEVLKNDHDRQAKFISLIFKKAVSSITYAHLFAKLCNDLEKELDPQTKEKEKDEDQNEENNKDKKVTFKSQLQDYSKNRILHKFQPDENINDREERFNVLKKEIKGIFNFITELVISKVLGKIYFYNLIRTAITTKLNDQEYLKFSSIDQNLGSIYMEEIILSVENFGTIINQPDTKIKPEPLKEINSNINDFIKQIGEILEINNTLSGNLKYLHLNLVEKTKNKWELTEVDKIKRAKGQKELEEAARHLKSNDFNQDDITTKIKEDLYVWKSCREEGQDPKHYPYHITNDLFQKRGCKLVNLLKSLRYLSIDAVNNKESAHDIAVYFYEHCSYYHKYEEKPNIEALKNEMIDILFNLSDLMLDNMILSIFFGEIIYSLLVNKYMKFSDFDSLCELSDDTAISAVVDAFYYASKVPTSDSKNFIKNGLETGSKFFTKNKEKFSKLNE